MPRVSVPNCRVVHGSTIKLPSLKFRILRTFRMKIRAID